MSKARKPLELDARDSANCYGAVRYGIALQLRKELEPQAHMPERFRDLLRALEKVERDRKMRQESPLSVA